MYKADLFQYKFKYHYVFNVNPGQQRSRYFIMRYYSPSSSDDVVSPEKSKRHRNALVASSQFPTVWYKPTVLVGALLDHKPRFS
jgi:hypothetical protein